MYYFVYDRRQLQRLLHCLITGNQTASTYYCILSPPVNHGSYRQQTAMTGNGILNWNQEDTPVFLSRNLGWLVNITLQWVHEL